MICVVLQMTWEGYESECVVITHEKGVKVWEWEHREHNQEKWVSHKYFVKIVMFHGACILFIYNGVSMCKFRSNTIWLCVSIYVYVSVEEEIKNGVKS